MVPERWSRIVGQDELGEPGGAEDVDLELVAGLGQGHVFERAVGAVAGVVDQHVDAAFFGEDLLDPGLHRLVVGDVHRQRADTGRGEVLHPLYPPSRGVGRVAEFLELKAVASPIPEEPPVTSATLVDKVVISSLTPSDDSAWSAGRWSPHYGRLLHSH